MGHVLIETGQTPLLRVDFGDQQAWEAVRSAVEAPVGGGLVVAAVDVVNDPRLADLTVEQVVAAVGPDAPHAVIVVADRRTMAGPGAPLLVIDRRDRCELRCAPGALWAIVNDTGIRGMPLHEFADDVDESGVFRGRGGPEGLERRLAALAELTKASGAARETPQAGSRSRVLGPRGGGSAASASGPSTARPAGGAARPVPGKPPHPPAAG